MSVPKELLTVWLVEHEGSARSLTKPLRASLVTLFVQRISVFLRKINIFSYKYENRCGSQTSLKDPNVTAVSITSVVEAERSSSTITIGGTLLF